MKNKQKKSESDPKLLDYTFIISTTYNVQQKFSK